MAWYAATRWREQFAEEQEAQRDAFVTERRAEVRSKMSDAVCEMSIWGQRCLLKVVCNHDDEHLLALERYSDAHTRALMMAPSRIEFADLVQLNNDFLAHVVSPQAGDKDYLKEWRLTFTSRLRPYARGSFTDNEWAAIETRAKNWLPKLDDDTFVDDWLLALEQHSIPRVNRKKEAS